MSKLEYSNIKYFNKWIKNIEWSFSTIKANADDKKVSTVCPKESGFGRFLGELLSWPWAYMLTLYGPKER